MCGVAARNESTDSVLLISHGRVALGRIMMSLEVFATQTYLNASRFDKSQRASSIRVFDQVDISDISGARYGFARHKSEDVISPRCRQK